VVSKGIISEAEATDLFKMYFLYLCFRDRSDGSAVFSTVVPLSSLSSIPRSILSHLCTNGLLLLLIVYAWSRLESVMVAVRYPVVIGRNVLNSIFVSSGKPSDVYTKCLQEVQTISCATLFAPVLRVEAVQAMSA